MSPEPAYVIVKFFADVKPDSGHTPGRHRLDQCFKPDKTDPDAKLSFKVTFNQGIVQYLWHNR